MDRGMYIFCMVMVFSLVIGGDRTVEAQNSQKNNECFTPNDLNGSCINIKRCPTLFYLVKYRRQNSTIATFLRNSVCGYENDFPYYPKVCCPLEEELNSTVSEIYETGSSIKLPSQQTCGRANATHIRTFGVNAAKSGSSPWMAALGYQKFTMSYAEYAFLCGGSLISDKYVLTAATCTADLGIYHLAIVRLGYSNLDPNVNDESEPIDVEISRVISHREYSKQKYTNDIALLEIKNTVVFNQFIQPICLPILSHHRAKTFVKSELFVTSFNFKLPELSRDAPMEFEVRVVDNSECQQKYNTSNIVINDKHLCAESTGLVPEQGISGSPLIWASGTQYYVVGVLNFGKKIQGPGHPDGYTRVTSFVEWIADNMKYS